MTKPTTDEFGEEAGALASSAQEKAREAFRAGSDYVRENPVPIIIGAVIFGAVLGALLVPREPRRQRDARHIARELLETVYDDLSDKLPQLKKQAITTRDSIADRVQELGQKLKWW